MCIHLESFAAETSGLLILNECRPDVCTLYKQILPSWRKNGRAQINWRRTARPIMSECKNSARKKSEEQAVTDSLARQQALEQLGITQDFNHLDHAKIYSFADHAVEAPIETVDSSIPPPDITQYPERSPSPERSRASPSPVRIGDAMTPSARTAVVRFARFRRAKAIMQVHVAK